MYFVRTVVMLVSVLFVTLGPALAGPGRIATPQVAAEARRGLEDILELWRDGNFDALDGRIRLGDRESREGFARKLRNSARRPACCWEKLQDVAVSVQNGGTVTVRGRFGLERGASGTEYATQSVRLVLDDGVWKASQADILSLAGGKRKGYRYVGTSLSR